MCRTCPGRSLFTSSLTERKVGAVPPQVCVNRVLLLQEHPGLFLSHHYISFRPIREVNEGRAFNLTNLTVGLIWLILKTARGQYTPFNLTNLTVGLICLKMYESPLTHLLCAHKF